jgi:fibronectin type 3 domain-containing protein
MPKTSAATMPRRFRQIIRLTILTAVVTTALVSAGTGSAVWTVGLVALDNGTCGSNLQLGSNKNASNTATPTFWLQGNGGLSKYDVYIDGAYVGRFSSDAWANVCISTTSRLSDGAHRLTGNEVQPNAANTITPLDFSVDTVPPNTPSIPTLMAFSDGGFVGDNITKSRTFTMTGTSDPSVTLQLTQSEIVIGGASASSTGTWQAAGTVWSDGVYQVKALAIDPAANRSVPSPARAVTVDTVLPNASILNPAAGATVSGTVPISVNASDLVGLWKVEWKVDNILRNTSQGTPLAGGTSTFNWASSGVANGPHTITAVATDLAGNQALPAVSVNVLNGVSSVPGAPILNTAGAASNTVALSWSAPLSDGGSAITSYTATASPGGASCTTSGALTCTIGGLTNGTTYSFTVTATNSTGTGPASNALTATPSAPVSAPSAPTLTSAARGNGNVALAWLAPGSNGGSPITGYTATATPGGATCTTAGALGCTIGGLANGTTYTFTVRAANAAGTGPASNSMSATPATTPGAPTLQSAAAGNGSVTLVWSAAYDGGSALVGYTAGSSPGGLMCTTTATSCTITGLMNGTTYMFSVTATNAVGTGPASNSLNATPATVPGTPTLNSAAAGNASVALAWSAPPSNGGSAITGYTATATPGGASCTTSAVGCTITGLTNGTTYTFTVTATNALGTGGASNPLSATPAAAVTVPGAPSLNSASAGNGSVALTWSAPASNGGSPITGYTATATPGGATCTTSALGCTIAGLANGTTYTFTVKATNAIGTGAASNSLSATPMTVPSAPTLSSAVPGNSVTLSWTAPANTGGAPITGYRIYRGTTSGFTSFLTSVGNVTGYTDATTTPGTTYYFAVTALTAAGESPKSNELSATPFNVAQPETTPPTSPGQPKAVALGTSQMVLDWTASTDNVGVTGYDIFVNGTVGATVSSGHGMLSGLRPATTYTVAVVAFDAAGNRSPVSIATSATTASVGTGTTGTLAGAVLDGAASRALTNAVVRTTVNGSTKSAKANNSGRWSMTNMPPGTYTMTATVSGYRTSSWQMTLTAGQTVLALTELSR